MSEKTIIYNKKSKELTFIFSYNPTIVTDIKEISGRQYNPDKKLWTAKLNEDNCKAVKNFILLHQFSGSQDLRTDILQLLDLKKDREKINGDNLILSSAIEPTTIFSIPTINGTLKQYQLAGVEYIVKNRKVLVADMMGLGKTLESIASIEYMNAYPVIVICPNSLTYNWKAEVEKWLPNRKYLLLKTETKIENVNLSDYEIIICSYNTFIKFDEILTKYNRTKSIIIDESHSIKNKKTIRAKSIMPFAKNHDIILLLSGTPVVNRPSELISQLQLLNIFKHFGNWKYFVERYCDAKQTEYGWNVSGASNLVELNTQLRKFGYLRRNKEDVLKELPNKIRIPIIVDITNRKEYNKAKDTVTKYIIDKLIKELNIPKDFDDQQRYQFIQENKALAITKLYNAQTLVQISILRKLAAIGKIEAVVEWIESFLEQENKLLLFGVHIDSVIKELQSHFKCNMIIGETDTETRQKYVDDFQTNTDTKLLLLNIATGGVGYNLTAANNVAFIEMDWTIGKHLQAEDRTHRIGQDKQVNCYYFKAKDTIDEKMYDLIMDKLRIIDAVNSGIEQPVITTTDEEKEAFGNVIDDFLKI
jgi:SWI/SNF-related matrix-associated actin-dependent regulator 1 of chromatin subfamily A